MDSSWSFAIGSMTPAWSDSMLDRSLISSKHWRRGWWRSHRACLSDGTDRLLSLASHFWSTLRRKNEFIHRDQPWMITFHHRSVGCDSGVFQSIEDSLGTGNIAMIHQGIDQRRWKPCIRMASDRHGRCHVSDQREHFRTRYFRTSIEQKIDDDFIRPIDLTEKIDGLISCMVSNITYRKDRLASASIREEKCHLSSLFHTWLEFSFPRHRTAIEHFSSHHIALQ